jgi:uncharacterized membrane protein
MLRIRPIVLLRLRLTPSLLDNMLTMFETGLWIRIRIISGFSDFVHPDPYWESGSRIRIQGQET